MRRRFYRSIERHLGRDAVQFLSVLDTGVKVQNRSGTDSSALRAVAFFIVPNLIMMSCNVLISGSRPGLFDLDYAIVPVVHALALIVVTRLAGPASIGLTVVLMAADLFSTITQIYFAGPAMVLDYLPFISLWPWRWIGAITLGIAAVSLPLVIGILGSSLRRRPAIVAIVLLATLLAASDRVALRLSSVTRPMPNLASSGMLDVLHPSIAQIIDEVRDRTPRLQRATSPTLASSIRAEHVQPARILSVSVESWGRLRDADADAAMVSPLIAGLHDRYAVTEDGLHEFYGATLAGEVRELCGLKETGGVPRGAEQYTQLRDCLPAWLARRGYRTVAVHGNAGSFYRRARLYPMMGFTENWHYEQMHGQVRSLCSYLFVGICDRDAARIAMTAFDATPKAFVHLMTLDTHLPLPPATAGCRVDPEPDLCAYRHAIARSLGVIAVAVRSGRVLPDLIVVYGDHAPPFIDARLRARFVDGEVPFLVLRRRP